MNEERFCTGKQVKKILQVSDTTLHRWVEENKIRAIRTPSGQRRYYFSDIQLILDGNHHPSQKQKVVYCRVSSSKQLDDLERQKSLLQQQFPHHQLVADVASGLNWKRKGLRSILEQAMRGHLSEIVVAHRDRLCRFSFDLLEWIFSSNGVKLVVLDQEENQSTESELADDILSLVHVYSCRQMGKRRYHYKMQKNQDLPHNDSKESPPRVDGNEEVCVQSGASKD
jgi:predicted site-specific integrase-resolvase